MFKLNSRAAIEAVIGATADAELLDQLPPSQREVVELTMQGASTMEIARQRGNRRTGPITTQRDSGILRLRQLVIGRQLAALGAVR